jgi:hypothetical protein
MNGLIEAVENSNRSRRGDRTKRNYELQITNYEWKASSNMKMTKRIENEGKDRVRVTGASAKDEKKITN